MNGNLDTTNLLLGIMAAVSVIEGLLLIGLCIAGLKIYRTVMATIRGVEERQIAPAMVKVNAVLEQVHSIASAVRSDTERVEQAIRHTIDRVDGTAVRVRDGVRSKASWIVGTIRGVRSAIEGVLRSERERDTDTKASEYGRTH